MKTIKRLTPDEIEHCIRVWMVAEVGYHPDDLGEITLLGGEYSPYRVEVEIINGKVQSANGGVDLPGDGGGSKQPGGGS